ncbi:hypothetical protein SDC9_124985 [bioreactor metagenome]|uniref:Peptidase G2 IMC autoproteolytic cleavage domain-containing protein n=1 Tax=bioreactor metagenome TaxID=1076179 RepID=A0A645CM46_9ZZZZ
MTLEEEKIRIANNSDSFILGVTSATPCFVGNSGELIWKNKFKKDEWGRTQYENVTVPAVTDKAGAVIADEHTIKQAIISPEYDETKNYVPRSDRPEWVTVGLMGQVLVRDDGTCQVNSYCSVSSLGIATASSTGYRVMKRTATNQILIFLK